MVTAFIDIPNFQEYKIYININKSPNVFFFISKLENVFFFVIFGTVCKKSKEKIDIFIKKHGDTKFVS